MAPTRMLSDKYSMSYNFLKIRIIHNFSLFFTWFFYDSVRSFDVIAPAHAPQSCPSTAPAHTPQPCTCTTPAHAPQTCPYTAPAYDFLLFLLGFFYDSDISLSIIAPALAPQPYHSYSPAHTP